jgi:two-component sensor histidine kinase
MTERDAQTSFAPGAPLVPQRAWFRRGDVSIAACLFGLIMALVVPLLLLAGWQLRMAQVEQQQALASGAALVARERQAAVDRSLSYYVAILETLAASQSIDDRNYERLHRQAASILDRLGIFVLLRSPDGQQLLNTRRPFGTALPKEVGFDDPVLATKRPYVSDLIIGAVAKTPVIGLSVPVIRKDALQGILTMSLEPRVFEELLATEDTDGWRVDLIDRDNVVIASTAKGPPAQDLQPGWLRRDDGTYLASGPGSTGPEVVAAQPSMVSGWTTIAYLDAKDIPAAPMRPALVFLFTSLGLGLLGLLVALFVTRMVVGAIGDAANAAARLGRREPIMVRPSMLREANVLSAALLVAGKERDAHEYQINVLMREVNHRSKNLLAVVQALARRSSAESLDEYRERLQGRLAGLAAGLDALVAQDGDQADLRTLLERQLAVFIDPLSARASLEGPKVTLSVQATQSIGMAIHELGTNATKYGSLSAPSGTVSLKWTANQGRLRLHWLEEGGPEVLPPARHGFGHVVTTQALETTYGATVSTEYGSQGLRWSLDVSLTAISPVPVHDK